MKKHITFHKSYKKQRKQDQRINLGKNEPTFLISRNINACKQSISYDIIDGFP